MRPPMPGRSAVRRGGGAMRSLVMGVCPVAGWAPHVAIGCSKPSNFLDYGSTDHGNLAPRPAQTATADWYAHASSSFAGGGIAEDRPVVVRLRLLSRVVTTLACELLHLPGKPAGVEEGWR